MRDMPMFTTDHGIASLTLNQIPYTKSAWIRLQKSSSPQKLLEECVSFCKAVGAENIYATGDPCCEIYPEHTKILKMQANLQTIGDTDACLFPVTETTREMWRTIYNDKIKSVPNGSWMTIEKSREMLHRGSGYFIHRRDMLLGIGMVDGNQICWVASVVAGAGEDVVKALCHAVTEDIVCLEVATANEKAMKLYNKLCFVPAEILSEWYKIQ